MATLKNMIPTILALGMILGCQEDLITGDGDGNPTGNPGGSAPSVELKVMSRNMYIGADVDKVIEETDALKIPQLVEEAWQTMLATDFPGRAEALAREIAEAGPHLVGLQEVYVIRSQRPGDFQLNADSIVFDFLATLVDELDELGTDYRVVGQVENSDVELPRFNREEAWVDVRVTDYDAVLARGDVEVANVVAENYQASFPVQSYEIRRGYIMLDATVEDHTFRFVNTHPEPASTADGYFQDLQVKELIQILDADPKPTILLGDLNTPAPESPVYGYFIDAGYQDLWTALGDQSSDGLTCCHAPALDNTAVDFHERIDLILVNRLDDLLPASAQLSGSIDVVGEELDDRTESGIWPSDHAGIVATIELSSPTN